MSTAVRGEFRAIPAQRLVSSSAVVIGTYLVALASAELLLLTSGLIAGAVSHAILIAILVTHAIAAPRAPYRRLLIVLMLPSLVRILGLTIPVASTPVGIWYLMAGTPALVGTVLAARVVGLPTRLVGRPSSVSGQLLISLSGVTNGLLAYLVLRPAALPGGAPTAIITAAILILVVAGTEELLFRGCLQTMAADLFGNPAAGIALSTAVFTLMYAGSLSPAFVILMFATGLFLSWAVELTGSLWGAMGAHAAMVVGLLVVWPIVLG
jgi:membrane protease YdiL (CAAX protease family)